MEPAHSAHAPALALIHASAFPPNARWGPDAMALQLGLPGAFGFIEIAEDDTGGMILVRTMADESEILTLAVMPETRRTGIARRLLAAAMEGAQARGATAMLLEVAADNTPARALYAQAGFTQVGLRRRYYPGGQDALILRAPLAQHGEFSSS